MPLEREEVLIMKLGIVGGNSERGKVSFYFLQYYNDKKIVYSSGNKTFAVWI